MHRKIAYHRLIFIIYLIALISFFFLNCQEISSQQLAACVTFATLPFLGRIVNSKATYKKEVLVFLAYMIVQIFISQSRYGQPIWATLYYIVNIFSMLLYVYFAGFSQDPIWYYATYKKFGKILLALLYFAAVAYYAGVQFMDSTVYRIRGNNLRLTVGMMISAFFYIIYFSEIITQTKKKSSLQDLTLAALIIICIFFVVQTRMNILAIGLSISCMMVFCIKNPSKKALIFAVAIVVLGVALQLPSVQNYINEYFGGVFNGTDNAMIPRVGAIPHYIEMAKEHKILGIGIINPNASSNGLYDLQYIMHGEWRVYSYDDVGVFSYYMMYGLVGVLMYAFIFVKLLKRAWNERYIMPYKLGIVVYVIVTGFSMIITDLWRQSNIALFLLLMDLDLTKSGQAKE